MRVCPGTIETPMGLRTCGFKGPRRDDEEKLERPADWVEWVRPEERSPLPFFGFAARRRLSLIGHAYFVVMAGIPHGDDMPGRSRLDDDKNRILLALVSAIAF